MLGLQERGPVFIDSGAWIAIRIREDRFHSAAAETWKRLVSRPQLLLTTNMVVGETYTYLMRHRGYGAAWAFIDWLESARLLQRQHITPELETQAYVILRQYRNHDFSFVDATSFALMRTHGISDAFAFDAHFSIAGFTRIPLAPR